MHPVARFGYELAGQLARAVAAVAPAGESKLSRSLALRRGIRRRYAEWSVAHRDRERPLLWMHAPSVGEGLQARPVLELARAERPRTQLAYTFFSPSAAAFARGLEVDFRDVLPFDTTGDARAALAALRPTALVYSKVDVWPILTAAAAEASVPLGMISATLSAASSRGGRLSAVLLRDAYARLDAVGAIDAQDAERLMELGVRRDVIAVTGDTRYDQVWARAQRADRSGTLLSPLASDRPTIVAGSTWPADEAILLPAFHTTHATERDVRLIIAPHEPTPAHLDPIDRWAADAGLRVDRLGAPGAATADVVLVDRVGILGDLYALADVAYVGGGFHRAGLHSVLEPASFGVPVLFGPRHGNSRDAALLLVRQGGAVVRDVSEMSDSLKVLATDSAARNQMGKQARALVQAGLGAARRSFELVERLLGA